MLPDLAQLPSLPPDGRPMLLVVTVGDADQNRELVEASGLRAPVFVQEGKEIAARFKATGTPTGYLIDERGTIASELAQGADALLALARGVAPQTVPRPSEVGSSVAGPGTGLRVRESRLARDGLGAGTPAPPFRLPRIGGGDLSLEEYSGQPVLLVFSDPGCGPCNELAPKLERLHRQSLDLEVLMISRGSPSANEAKIVEHRLTFPVVLQRHWEISRMYAMFATPIAYLLDEHLTVAADVALGPDAIVQLATRRMAPGRSPRSAASVSG
jgi:peroxiredoxin